MSTITRERVAEFIKHPLDNGLTRGEQMELARIALASLEAEPVAWAHRLINKRNGVVHPWVYGSAEACPSEGDIFNIEVMPLYTAPPAPVSVPAAMEMDDDFDSAFEHGKAVGWNAYRAAMLQGADRPQNEPQNIPENIPATQFKPVADLYGLTSPTGGETSFTFDAVEARDFIDGGWSCQEYVELERFQEAITNHTEDKLAMVDHSGDSNNMVEPVTTAYKLPDDFDFDRFNDVVWLEAVASNPHMHSLTTSTIAMVALELNRKLADCNSPVIPDGWIPVSERMPGSQEWVIVFAKWDNQQVLCWDDVANRWTDFEDQSYYADMFTHWMPLPAAPQQES
ncbi:MULTISPECIES: DUF551 domain-containing protein [unclassified Enterobacter]|uniref:DUF551 domain-containing protein n=1 Tax=unclassified Enterobacter TaxID=2608935 RepID=UPI002147C98C|nr:MULTISPECIES: DUF551 domain-containing protein [unclassified Enterobacter]MCR1304658.1 DUF551 domain-containing protein [Enterobacter sp. FL1277]MCR1309747.1 DUF551 domain-containing protein [Enterobacter sp. BT1271]MCR1311565.1 DUF551 domain-containing protein [Enterobacter sp. BT855]MCR1325376.1 DUF551 domain-containing protein [Enterobacter sp. BT1268]MCR1329389.1 DUF551 domain-containing protein [Enterobacter sp. BT1131]